MEPVEQEQFIVEQLDTFKTLLHAEDAVSLKVQRVLHYVHEHLFDPALSVGGTLQACGIRSHGFNARFKTELFRAGYGWCTLREYIEQKRMEAAERLVRHHALSLTLIAQQLGFRRYQTFYRAFKRRFGCSPSAFRDRLGDDDG